MVDTKNKKQKKRYSDQKHLIYLGVLKTDISAQNKTRYRLLDQSHTFLRTRENKNINVYSLSSTLYYWLNAKYLYNCHILKGLASLAAEESSIMLGCWQISFGLVFVTPIDGILMATANGITNPSICVYCVRGYEHRIPERLASILWDKL